MSYFYETLLESIRIERSWYNPNTGKLLDVEPGKEHHHTGNKELGSKLNRREIMKKMFDNGYYHISLNNLQKIIYVSYLNEPTDKDKYSIAKLIRKSNRKDYEIKYKDFYNT